MKCNIHLYIYKENSGFSKLAVFICLGIQYIKMNMIFSILLVDTMSCMWLFQSHCLVCLHVWKTIKWTLTVICHTVRMEVLLVCVCVLSFRSVPCVHHTYAIRRKYWCCYWWFIFEEFCRYKVYVKTKNDKAMSSCINLKYVFNE